MAIIKVAWAGLKKRKVYSISILLLIFMIALFSIIGITMLQGISQTYDDTHKNTNSIHIQYLFEEVYGGKAKEFEQWFQKDNRIKEVKLRNILNLRSEAFNFKDKKKVALPIYLHSDIGKFMNNDNKITELDLDYNEIALPLYYSDKYNLKEGDYFDIFLDDKTISLKIDSFFIDPVYGSEMVGMKKVILNAARLKDMIDKTKELSSNQSVIKEIYFLGVIVKDEFTQNINQINDDFYNNNDVPMTISYSLDIFKTGSLFMANIILSIIIAFSVLLLLIIILVIRNAINSAIETDFKNIGILKSLGFSSLQILMSLVLQFSFLSVIGTVLGVTISIILIPLIGEIVLSTTGLIWTDFPSVKTMFIVVFNLLTLINCLIFITSRKVIKITPVEAISSGKSDVYFKSYLNIPLKKLSVLPLNLRIGLKQILTRVNKYIMIIIISLVLSLSIGITLISVRLFSDSETTAKIFGYTDVNLGVRASDEESVETIIEDISNKYNVLYYDLTSSKMVSVGSKNIFAIINKDFEKGNFAPLKGRFPRYDNEVTLTKILSKHLGKKIGDTIIISNVTGEEKLEFIITGYHQNAVDMGNNMFISAAGIKRIDKKAQLTNAELLLDEKFDIKKIVNEFEEKYESGKNGVDIYEVTDEGTMMDTIKGILSGLALGICILVCLIISVITMLLAFIAIHKENKELGVYKALGYGTLQMRLQFAARFGTVALIGSLIGSSLNSVIGADLLGIMLLSIGLGRLQMDFSLVNFLIPIGLVSTVAYLVSFFASKRIKKVSPRELISE